MCGCHSEATVFFMFLQAVGLHCFQPSTLEKVHVICKSSVGILNKQMTIEIESKLVAADCVPREISDSHTTTTGKVSNDLPFCILE